MIHLDTIRSREMTISTGMVLKLWINGVPCGRHVLTGITVHGEYDARLTHVLHFGDMKLVNWSINADYHIFCGTTQKIPGVLPLAA